MNGKAALFENTIDRDREFDQTARTEPPRHVSPAIREFQIERLKQELKFERIEHAKTQDRLAAAESRIRGFEKMSAALARHADALMIQFERITGRTPEQMLEIAAAEQTPAEAAA